MSMIGNDPYRTGIAGDGQAALKLEATHAFQTCMTDKHVP